MSAADIGASGSSYQGNAELGGLSAGVIKIDTSPIMQLAGYTVQYNKSMWEQSHVDAQNKIAELAKITALNPNDAIPKDKDEALAAYNDLIAAGSEYAVKSPKNNEEKVQFALDWQKKLAQAGNLITSANARAKSFQARKVDIQSNTAYSAEQKQLRLNELEKEANAGNIYTPIAALDTKFDLTVPKIGDPAYAKIDLIKTDASGNGNMTYNHTLFDPEANMSASFLVSQGLADLQTKKPTSDLERQQLDLQKASSNDQIVWNDASNFLNNAINDPKYKDGEKINFERIESENPIVANIIGIANKWNDYANKVKSDIASGVYTDVNGETKLDPKKYFNIDPTKGISASQMVFLERFAKANPDALDTKYTHTGDATAAGRLAVESKKADADIIYKKAMAGAAGMKAKAYVANVKQQMALRKTDAEKDALSESLFTHNLLTQQQLYTGVGGSKVLLKIDADNSLPMLTFDGNSVKQLAPIGGTPIGTDGQPIKEGDVNKKVAYYKGGYFRTEYKLKANGKVYSPDELSGLYKNFKEIKKRNGEPWAGSFDDFLKKWVGEDQFDVKIIGRDGATDKQVMSAAQRAISNKATSKGEQGVFDAPLDPVIPDNNSTTNLDASNTAN